MRNKLGIIGKVSSAAILLCVGIITTLLSVSAKADGLSIMDKTLLNAVNYCYTSGRMKSPIAQSKLTGLSGLSAANSIINKSSDKDNILIPTQYENSVKNSKISCAEVFDGAKGLTGGGVLTRFGEKVINSDTIVADFGYKASGESFDKKCVSIKYLYKNTGEHQTNTVCIPVDKNNKIIFSDVARPENSKRETISESNGIYISFGAMEDWSGGVSLCSSEADAFGCVTYDISDGRSWDEFHNDLTNGSSRVPSVTNFLSTNLSGPTGFNKIELIESTSSGSSASTEYKLSNKSEGAKSAIKYLSGYSIADIKFTEKDKYDLYTEYFNRVNSSSSSGISIDTDASCTKSKPSSLAVRQGEKWCKVYGAETVTEKFNVIKDDGTGLKSVSFEEVIKGLMNINYKDSSMEDADLSAAGSTPSSSEDPDEDVSVACSKTGVLSWIMCPVIQLFYDGIMGMYSYIEGNFLEINSGYLLTNGNSQQNAVYEGWKKFRDFANIAFVIMLVIVILSQVTGFGISNYGIKKALPKLIVVAILVNLSFLFCQLAVDVSNILGYTLRSMFRDIASKIGGTAFELPSMLESVVSFTLLGAGTAAILKFTQFWKDWVSLLIPALAGIMIGILFFFIVLGVRQAGVLILVVISPIAIICYALPNTKSLFDRWKRTLTSLLLVFPICGALMGGGQLAATIIASSPGYTINEDIEEMKKDKGTVSVSTSVAIMASIPATHFADSANVSDSKAGSGTSIIMGIIAMLVQVAPFFMVPSLVRNSMNALGNIGNKLTQTGARWSRGASNALGKTEAMQDLQRRMEASKNLGMAMKYEKGRGLRNRVGSLLSKSNSEGAKKLGSTLQASAKRSRTRFANAYNKSQTEDEQIAIDNTELYTEGSEARETMKTRLMNEQMEKSIKAQRYNIANSEISDDVAKLRGALDQHREDLGHNPDDESTKAKVYAHLDQLTAQGDAGMTQVGQAIQAAIANDDLESAQIMSRYILKNYGKQYKDKQRGTFDMAGDLSRLNLENSAQVSRFKQKANLSSRARTRTVLDDNGNETQETYAFYTSDYDKNGIDSLDAQRISDLNEDTLTRYHELAMTGQLNPQQMAALSRISARALANDENGTGHVQDKLRGKLGDLANMGIGQSSAFARAIQGSVDPNGSEASRREALSQAQGIARSMTGSSDGWQRLTSQMTRMGSAGSAAVQGSLRSVMQDIGDNTNNLSNATPMQSRLASDISAGDFTHLQSSNVREVSGINEGETEFSSDYYENNVAAFQHSAGSAPNPNLVDGRSDFGSMDLSQLQRMTRQAMYSWGATTNPDGTISHGGFKNNTAFNNQFEYNNVAQGITKALQSDERFKDPANAQKVKELNKFLAAGGFKTVNPNKVKIPLPERPKGWRDDGNFYNDTGQRITPTPIQQEEYNQWVKDVVSKKRINEENGFKDE